MENFSLLWIHVAGKLLHLKKDPGPAHTISSSPYVEVFEKPERHITTHLLPNQHFLLHTTGVGPNPPLVAQP